MAEQIVKSASGQLVEAASGLEADLELDDVTLGDVIVETVTNAGLFKTGSVTAEQAPVKGVYISGTIAVTVPAITDPDIASVDVSTAAMTFACAVGDAVVAIPSEAMETNARIQNAYVTAADTVRVVFGSLGGNVTGSAKNFTFLFFDLT